MSYRFLGAIAFILLNTFQAYAYQIDFKEKVGQSSLAQVLEEEEDDARFSFWETDLGFRHGDDKASVIMKANHRERNYKNRDSDYSGNRWLLSTWRKSNLQEETVRWGGELSVRDRNYDNPALSNFREFRTTLFTENYRGWSAKLSDAIYDSRTNNENKLSGQIEREITQNQLALKTGFNTTYHYAPAQNRSKWKEMGFLRADWQPNYYFWDKTSLDVEAGQADTKDSDDREDNSDFSFWNIRLQNNHPLSPTHDLKWNAAYKEKNDKGGLFTYKGFAAEALPSWRPGWEDFPVKIEGVLGFKNMRFLENERLTYHRYTLGARLAWISWGNWKIRTELLQDFYTFPNQQNRTAKTTGKVEFEQAISENFGLNLGSKFRNSLVSLEAGLTLKL